MKILFILFLLNNILFSNEELDIKSFINKNNEIKKEDNFTIKYRKTISKNIRTSLVSLEYLNQKTNGKLFLDKNNLEIKEKLKIMDEFLSTLNNVNNLDSLFMEYTMTLNDLNFQPENIKE